MGQGWGKDGARRTMRQARPDAASGDGDRRMEHQRWMDGTPTLDGWNTNFFFFFFFFFQRWPPGCCAYDRGAAPRRRDQPDRRLRGPGDELDAVEVAERAEGSRARSHRPGRHRRGGHGWSRGQRVIRGRDKSTHLWRDRPAPWYVEGQVGLAGGDIAVRLLHRDLCHPEPGAVASGLRKHRRGVDRTRKPERHVALGWRGAGSPVDTVKVGM